MRPKLYVAVSGPVAGGKSTLAKALAKRFSGLRLSTRALLTPRLSPDEMPTRSRLQEVGRQYDEQTSGKWVAEGFSRQAFAAKEELIIIDSVRRAEQVEAIRRAFGSDVRHVHITAPLDTCEERYNLRRKEDPSSEDLDYTAIRADSTEAQIESLGGIADIEVDTLRSTPEDVLVRVAARLGLLSGLESDPCVDTLIGGLYGSEGKGNIAYHLAPEYDLLVRVGGPNAAHSVYLETETKFVHYSLPSGTQAGQQNSHLLIGAGAVVFLDELLDEISRSHVSADRLTIDPQVMIIEPADKQAESELRKRIGSTASGTGSASSRRLLRTNDVRLARDITELAPYVRTGLDVLARAYRTRQRIFLEGTQGSGLSLFHGPYPYVTSRDTNTAGCLAEAGIPPARLRRTIMVVRTYPIRVAGTSGDLRNEISWDIIGKRSGLDAAMLKEKEHTSKTRTLRRVGEFEWDLLHRASLLNAPTDIALTFADYIDAKNAKAWRYSQLTEETLQFIDEIERVSGARVSLISTGFMPRRGVIDRRVW